MSLDVYLIAEKSELKKVGSGIFIRKNGRTVEITESEWNTLYPNIEPVRMNSEETVEETNEVFDWNITHNLNIMAEEAGIYKHLWRPEEIGITTASELIEPLRQGLHELKLNPEKYKKFNPENGWGDYEGLVEFVENYLNACYKYPNAKVVASR
jgi:hypothetical protein